MLLSIISGILPACILLLFTLMSPKKACPRCGYVRPRFRWPASLQQCFGGGWTCRGCGIELDTHGEVKWWGGKKG
jgi:hypothetical protein